jgi:hypothetical protein
MLFAIMVVHDLIKYDPQDLFDGNEAHFYSECAEAVSEGVQELFFRFFPYHSPLPFSVLYMNYDADFMPFHGFEKNGIFCEVGNCQ